jgi:hypothetical protein
VLAFPPGCFPQAFRQAPVLVSFRTVGARGIHASRLTSRRRKVRPNRSKKPQRSQQLISTRSAAEDLVYALSGSIPPAGNLAAHTTLKFWMRGTEVGSALKARQKISWNPGLTFTV